jgi:formyl-CoA transferase
LSGVRIIDMTHNQAGPACTQILGFLGADVIKLEEPKGGDIARVNMRDQKNSDSLFFLILNANKRSLTLNLKTDAGKDLFRKVIAQSDVLVENFGPGALDRLGFGYAAGAKRSGETFFLRMAASRREKVSPLRLVGPAPSEVEGRGFDRDDGWT